MGVEKRRPETDGGMKWVKGALLFIWLVLLSWSWWVEDGRAAMQLAADPYALLDGVNQFRAANGLSPYQMNSSLMISAQGHSNWQASLSTWTHEGPGGTNETQRAAAAGYGGGASIKCDEAVAVNYKGDVNKAVYEQWQDIPHIGILLSSQYVDAGTGATLGGDDMVYFTLDVCRVMDGSSQTPGGGVQNPTAPPIFALQTSTPGPDGSVRYKVRPGDTLISIAQAHGISLETLLTLNGLTQESTIFPDQELLIQSGVTTMPTNEASATPELIVPSPTQRPTRTPIPPTPTATFTQPPVMPIITHTATPVSILRQDLMDEALLVGVVVLAALGVGMIALGGFLRRNSDR